MKPTPAELYVEMEDQASTMEMDVDDAEALDIFREGPLDTADHHRLTDSDFFNSFEDDFNDADIN
ncbi:small acidic protein 1 [Lactuca sativa]|nr:small acidic protein 1 [Lactuca sativa]